MGLVAMVYRRANVHELIMDPVGHWEGDGLSRPCVLPNIPSPFYFKANFWCCASAEHDHCDYIFICILILYIYYIYILIDYVCVYLHMCKNGICLNLHICKYTSRYISYAYIHITIYIYVYIYLNIY